MSNKAAAGFTLLEVVVALTIASLALVVMFRAGSDGLFAVDAAGRAEIGVERARSHLAAVGRDAAILQGVSEGEDGGGYHWRMRIAPIATWPAPATAGMPEGGATLFDVEVTISWTSRGRYHDVILRTRRIAPGTASR
jgi:general secretion pathway protein I